MSKNTKLFFARALALGAFFIALNSSGLIKDTAVLILEILCAVFIPIRS